MTIVPSGPEVGVKLVTVGARATMKLALEVPVPQGVVTEIGPVVAPAGTVAVTSVSLTKVKDADVPLNATAWTPVK